MFTMTFFRFPGDFMVIMFGFLLGVVLESVWSIIYVPSFFRAP